MADALRLVIVFSICRVVTLDTSSATVTWKKVRSEKWFSAMPGGFRVIYKEAGSTLMTLLGLFSSAGINGVPGTAGDIGPQGASKELSAQVPAGIVGRIGSEVQSG